MIRTFASSLVVALLLMAMTGCQPKETRTFAGFTYGGGGHTFSAEPAVLTVNSEQTVLECGKEGDATYLRLTWESNGKQGEELAASTGVLSVEGKPSSNLQSGFVVVQSEKGKISHGSFDLETKTPDGRLLKVVGSFSAEKV
jgi:hypothetical protein